MSPSPPLPFPFTGIEIGIRTGMTAGHRIWLCVSTFDGVSLAAHPDILARLAAVVEDHALAEAHRTTNCATSMRWAWALAGCQHPWCRMPDEEIRALNPAGPVAWDLAIAKEMGALVHPPEPALLDEGWGMHYLIPGTNDDHMETCGSKQDPEGQWQHAGGGRSQNAITVGRGDVRWSLGRPLFDMIDPSKLIPELRKFDENVTPNDGDEIA